MHEIHLSITKDIKSMHKLQEIKGKITFYKK